uniref:protein-serine/threonine phosphatase n=1 Tax=Oryctolagus cuniculus TaxID=9986 RepID=A0A5F9DVD5_RABIT
MLRGAVLGLQDNGDNDGDNAASEASLELGEEQPHREHTDGDHTDGHGPQKQAQRQHLHLMVELLRPQDDIRLAAQLEAARPPRLRYLLVVCTREPPSQDETVLLGVDFPDSRWELGRRGAGKRGAGGLQRSFCSLPAPPAAPWAWSCPSGVTPRCTWTEMGKRWQLGGGAGGSGTAAAQLWAGSLGPLLALPGFALCSWSRAQSLPYSHLVSCRGFSVTSGGQSRIFKPISIQTMWATLQVLHQACEAALGGGLVPGGSALAWATHYQERLDSDQGSLNEWMAMADLESLRPPSAEPGRSVGEAEVEGRQGGAGKGGGAMVEGKGALAEGFVPRPLEQQQMEQAIRAELWKLLDASDLESITSKEIRQALEQRLGCPLQQYRDFIDNQMLLFVAQQDRASRIFPHLYLGSEWNAANLEELQRNRVSHILNMAREIDNFYPERFTYHNVRLWDEESAQLLPHWKETHRFIEDARAQGTRVLVHCKMGVSRSAATVVAYAMKQYSWSLEQALRHVQELRPVVRPNPGFLRQLQTYQGILTASRQSHIWEQKVGGASLEEPLAPEVSTPLPPLPPEPGGSGEAKALVLEESQAGPRPRINLRGVMRSISLLEPPSELEGVLGDSELPEVFPAQESSDEEPCPQLSRAKGDQWAHRRPWPALKSRQSVVALQSAALVASRTQAFQEQGQVEAGTSSTPRLRKVVRQARVDDSRGEDEGSAACGPATSLSAPPQVAPDPGVEASPPRPQTPV